MTPRLPSRCSPCAPGKLLPILESSGVVQHLLRGCPKSAGTLPREPRVAPISTKSGRFGTFVGQSRPAFGPSPPSFVMFGRFLTDSVQIWLIVCQAWSRHWPVLGRVLPMCCRCRPTSDRNQSRLPHVGRTWPIIREYLAQVFQNRQNGPNVGSPTIRLPLDNLWATVGQLSDVARSVCGSFPGRVASNSSATCCCCSLYATVGLSKAAVQPKL